MQVRGASAGAAAARFQGSGSRFQAQPRYSGVAGEAAGSQRAGIASGHSPVAGSGGVIHPTTQHSPLAHSTTGTPVQDNWNGDDWMSDFKEANHDAYFAPAYYEIPKQGSSRESVLMQGVNAVNAFGDAFSSGARGMIHDIVRHPVQSTVNVLKGLATLGEAAYDLGNEISHLAGLPASTAAIARNHAREIGVVNAYHAESRAFRTGTVVQDAAMLGSAALFVAESLGAGGVISNAGRLAFSASRLGRVGLFGRAVEEIIIPASASRHPLEGWTPQQVVEYANQLGLKTKRDQLILWSGLGRGDAGVRLSQEYAAANGGVTLEMTPGGKWLNEMNLYGSGSPFSRYEAGQIWEKISTSMIQQASGQVRSLIGLVEPTSIYRAEQSELLMNKNILGLDELNIRPRYRFGNN